MKKEQDSYPGDHSITAFTIGIAVGITLLITTDNPFIGIGTGLAVWAAIKWSGRIFGKSGSQGEQ
jgi:F0F1-type ATP synthase membrane subunit c/vacuolar-type H+-ATPase subunit K